MRSPPRQLVDPYFLPLSCLGFPVLPRVSLDRPAPVGPFRGPTRPAAAFTDGSFSPFSGGCGSGVVLCHASRLESPSSLAGAPLVTLAVPAPAAGKNWAAELVGILVAMLMVPVNVSLDIYTDAESAELVVRRRVLPLGARLRSGCRALVVTIRWLICLRASFGGKTSLHPVRAHTGGKDTLSLLNAVADRLAGEGAVLGPSPPFLINEEMAVFWSITVGADGVRKLEHIAGDLRPVHSKKLKSSALAEWTGKPSQGLVVKSNPGSLLHLIRLVRRANDHWLHMFLMLFSTRQSPTADRMLYGADRVGLATVCHLCGKAHQSALHVFSCRFSALAVRNNVADASAQIANVLSLAAPFKLGLSDWPLREDASRWLRFFDPEGLVDPPDLSSASDGAKKFVVGAFRHDCLAGLLGVFPPGLEGFLFPDPALLGFEGSHLRGIRKRVRSLLDSLQMSLLRSSYAVFMDYQSAVLGVPDLSPADLLCGLRMQGVVVGRAHDLCGLEAAPASPAVAPSLRFRKGAAVCITGRSSALASACRLARPLVRRPVLAPSRLPSGRRSCPARRRVPLRGGKLSIALRRSSQHAEALLRLDVWRGRAITSSRRHRRELRLRKR